MKRIWRAESVEQLPRIMKRAFRLMTGGEAACAVMLPMDVQCDSLDVQRSRWNRETAITALCGRQINRKGPFTDEDGPEALPHGGRALRAKAGELIEELGETRGAAIVTPGRKGSGAGNTSLVCLPYGLKGTPVGLEVCRKAT